MASIRFHLAFPVHDLDAARSFYVDGLGCEAGRASEHSLILNLRGSQIVAQLSEDIVRQKGIYPRHFGLVFKEKSDWEELWAIVEKNGLKVHMAPRQRFPGSPIEHFTFFLEDPSGNLLEFKHYVSETAIFGEAGIAKVGDR